MKYDGTTLMEGIQKPDFQSAKDAKLKKSEADIFAVRHAQAIFEPFQEIDGTQHSRQSSRIKRGDKTFGCRSEKSYAHNQRLPCAHFLSQVHKKTGRVAGFSVARVYAPAVILVFLLKARIQPVQSFIDLPSTVLR